jgi:ABC-type hemin transport system substrate-binding protein
MSSAMPDQRATAPETPDELRAEIEQTREELAQTAQALGDKLDVKQQARSVAGSVQERVQEVPSRAAAQWDRDPVPLVAAVATFVTALVVLVWRDYR